MQTAVIEFARSVLGYVDADSFEFNAESGYPIIDIPDGQENTEKNGGAMRLGSYPDVYKRQE